MTTCDSDSLGKTTMYDIVVNADNILMDIYRSLQIVFKEENLNFDPNNVLTGDYNSDLGLIERHMLPFKNMILDFIADPRVYRLAPVDWGLIAYIKNCADKGTRFLIYTISPTKSVQMTKHALFTQWFTGSKNIWFAGEQSSTERIGFARGTYGRVFIDSFLDNFRNCEQTAYKYLIDKSYNQPEYNNDYTDVFNDSRLIRCSSAQQVLEFAVGKVMTLKLQERPV